MDRTFLSYYEEELAHIRELAAEFAALRPTVARNLSMDVQPCPDPYVERLLEGVAFLAARTRRKVDGESTRYVEALLDALAPELLAPGPACAMAVLVPGPQMATLPEGHVVPARTPLVAAFREGLATRMTFTTAQAVPLWPVRVERADYLPDRAALAAAGLGPPEAAAALRLTVARDGPGALAELSLDRLDLHLGSGALWDAVHGAALATVARRGPLGAAAPGAWRPGPAPALVGLEDEEALLPPARPGFGGLRLLREYFLMPERFHYLRLDGLRAAVAECGTGPLEVAVLLSRPRPALADVAPGDFRPFVTPVVNLFERECDRVDLDPRRSAHPGHADRAQPRDFEVWRLLRVEDADWSGPEAEVRPLHGLGRGGGATWAAERRPRRPGEDEVRRGQMRTSYGGDDLWLSVAGGGGMRGLDVRALCTNRDLPLLDDHPRLLVETGDPVASVELLSALRAPVPGGHGRPPWRGPGGETGEDDVAWRLVAQLALGHLSLAEEGDGGPGAEPLRALLDLHADRGDPSLRRHAQAVRRLRARRVVERLGLPGPLCFGAGLEVTLEVDEGPLAGGSHLLLTALIARLMARHVAVNGFVRTRARLLGAREEVAWPMTLGARAMI